MDGWRAWVSTRTEQACGIPPDPAGCGPRRQTQDSFHRPRATGCPSASTSAGPSGGGLERPPRQGVLRCCPLPGCALREGGQRGGGEVWMPFSRRSNVRVGQEADKRGDVSRTEISECPGFNLKLLTPGIWQMWPQSSLRFLSKNP